MARRRTSDGNPLEAVNAIEQFGPIRPNPERDRQAALAVADHSLTYDQPEQVCGEVLDMLGLRRTGEIASATRSYPHGSVVVAETGCVCYRCGKTRARRAVQS